MLGTFIERDLQFKNHMQSILCKAVEKNFYLYFVTPQFRHVPICFSASYWDVL